MPTAHVSPPRVHLKAEDKAILVYISPPGEDGTMWAQEKRCFNYTIRIWGRSFPVRVSFCFYLFGVRKKEVNEF